MARRLVDFAEACVGRAPGMLPMVAILVAMLLGGISGSGPATAAAVGGVMIVAMARAGYPAAFSASVVGAAAATDILIPPSIAFIVYSVNVPGASVPALFAAGMVPGMLAGLALIVPAVLALAPARLRRRRSAACRGRRSGGRCARPSWGLAAPVLILGGMRVGWFTPTEAAVVAVAYGLFIGVAIHRRSAGATCTPIFREATETSAVIMLVLALAGIFAYSVNTLGVADPLVACVKDLGLGLRPARCSLLLRGHDWCSAWCSTASRSSSIFLPLLYPLMLRLPLGPGLVRRAADDEHRDRPVHAADGGQPDGRRAGSPSVRIDETLPGSAGWWSSFADRLARASLLVPEARAVAAAAARLLNPRRQPQGDIA